MSATRSASYYWRYNPHRTIPEEGASAGRTDGGKVSAAQLFASAGSRQMYDQHRVFLATAIFLAALVIALIGACVAPTQIDPAASESMAMGAVSSGTFSEADSVRPPSADVASRGVRTAEPKEAEWQREERMRTLEVLAFFRIQPGMTVLDLYSGSNYYLEALSQRVGNQGNVVVYDKPPHRRLAEDDIAIRTAVGHPKNVTFISGRDKELQLPRGAYDVVLMILVYHDVYVIDNENGWTKVDGPKMLARIYESLKPGAVLGIVDYVATSGEPSTTAGTLHRIDPELIKSDLTASGFLFDGESEALRNYSDDLSRPVYGESVRRSADRTVLRFRKPVGPRN
jgi:predicted methyltransferase